MKSLLGTMLAAASLGFIPGFGQAAEEPITLIAELDNMALYRDDVADPGKLAQDPGVTTTGSAKTFQITYSLGDIVAINGKPAKGLNSTFTGALVISPTLRPGQVVADFNGVAPFHGDWQILGLDGNWIGSLWGYGAAPPSKGWAITAGQGAFFGVSGEGRFLEMTKPQRAASVSEDPANRRIYGGGKMRFIFYLYPKYRPSVDVTPAGPSVYHGDFSPVTASSPARAGEILIAAARNLGPTRPDLLPPGTRQFKTDPIEEVNSPVEVSINGNSAEVLNKIGWPGTSDLYRLDFRVPSGIAPGLATVQLTAAWIPGPEVKIAVQ